MYGCACGQNNELELNHSLCELGRKSCQLWIEDAITGNQHNVNGWTGFSNYSYIYTCAVTDPEDAACAYKIRYAYYWLKDEDSCMAYRYETWQFGYNEETGEYQHEITYKTSEALYHNYVYEYVVNGTNYSHKYDCADCGSYYYTNYYYDDDGNHIKYEKLANNTLNNGYDKYRACVLEYAKDTTGRQYTSREYYKYIYANDTEYWHEYLINEQAYTGAFGDSGREGTSSYTSSDGSSFTEKYAYVWYKGYEFCIYTYRTEGDYWYKYDYTYTFTDGCVRTDAYTNSYGANQTTINKICMFYNRVTIKNPTCSQDGAECRECVICGKHGSPYVVTATDHTFKRPWSGL